MTGAKEHQLVITKDTEVVLRVSNPLGTVTRKLSISVSTHTPTIKSFTSNLPNNIIQSNDDIILSWEVLDFETIEISGLGEVTNRNSITIKAPQKEPTFVLTATT